jgi:transcriptional regulator with XRE-family HTH domain
MGAVMTRTTPTGHPEDLVHRQQVAGVCRGLREQVYGDYGGFVALSRVLGINKTTIRQWERPDGGNWRLVGLAGYLDHYGVTVRPHLYNVPTVDESDLMAVAREAADLAAGRGDQVAATMWRTAYVACHMMAVQQYHRLLSAEVARILGVAAGAVWNFEQTAGRPDGATIGKVQAYARAYTLAHDGSTGFAAVTLTDSAGTVLLAPDPLDAAAVAA